MVDNDAQSFVNHVCWKPEMFPEALNTLALDVHEAVFKATHYPSFIQQEAAAKGGYVRVSEDEFLNDFLDDSHRHVFDIAVGDSGTGKSHLIRWLFHEIMRRNKASGERYWVVLIPRSSANLADVVRRVLKNATGELAERLKRELTEYQGLPLPEAKIRVLDELALVLQKGDRDLLSPGRKLEEEEEGILEGLPALLHSEEARRILFDRENGIVSRVAQHVLGKRESTESEHPDLRWTQEDLFFLLKDTKRMGGHAAELADIVRDDDRARETAVGFINRAQPLALKNLLRFRTGSLKDVVAEIRADLLSQGKELVVLVEDLSVTEGLDTELVEALQVRQRDTGDKLCRLRSIVGVTHEDYSRIRENIAEGRTLRTLFFNMKTAAPGASEGVRPSQILEFASRYLNAVRFSLKDLSDWADEEPPSNLPNACEACPLKGPCHAAFGESGSMGLYPFSQLALLRLYDKVAESRYGTDRAFNPRLMVARVLDPFLREADSSISRGAFPRPQVADVFGLASVKAEVEHNLQQRFPVQSQRLQSAIEVFAPEPSAKKPELPEPISAAFGLPELTWEPGGVKVKPKTPEIPPEVKVSHQLDIFDSWFRKKKPLEDRDLNRWREAIRVAVQAYVDWDAPGMAVAKKRFINATIMIEGQFTKARGEVLLEVKRSTEAAMVLRDLIQPEEELPPREVDERLRRTRRLVAKWSGTVVNNLLATLSEPGEPRPIELGASLLGLGALLRAAVAKDAARSEILEAALEKWPVALPVGRSEAWNALWEAFRRKSETVQMVLRESLTLSKGGTVGNLIDSGPVVPVLRAVLETGRPLAKPAEAADWKRSKEITELARAVELHLDQALRTEVEAARTWLGFVQEQLGEEQPEAGLAALAEAVTAAAGIGGLQCGAVPNFTSRLDELRKRKFAGLLQEVRRACEESDPTGQLLGVARLDRKTMLDLQTFLVDACKVLDATAARIGALSVNQAEGKDPDTIAESLVRISCELEDDVKSLEEVANG